MPAADSELEFRLRPPAGDASGALVLLHGRGADEYDLYPLLDMLDPARRLLGVTPRGPLALPPGGAHWYQVARVGYPDPSTFFPTFDTLTSWFDSLLADHGVSHDRAVVGGFSQGAVMSYALSFGADRPRPALVTAFSGFIPDVDGFEIDLSDLSGYPIAIGHGTYDPIIEVEWGRRAKQTLEAAGADVHYRESPMPHTIDPEWITEVAGMVDRVLGLNATK